MFLSFGAKSLMFKSLMVNVKQLAFCLKIGFQSKTGICLQITEVSTTGGYFNIT